MSECATKCGWLGSCKCSIEKAHPDVTCSFRISATCAIPVECEHGRDVCPECDPCTCGKGES